MDGVAVAIPRIVPIRPKLWVPAPASEELFAEMERLELNFTKKALSLKNLKDRILFMAGSKSNYLSKKFSDLALGATAYTAPSPLYFGLWTAALADGSNGGTAGEAAYTSYDRLSLTNNTTIFAAGTGSTTYSKTFPSDAAKSWPTSGGGTSPTVTNMGIFDANTKTGTDNLMYWCTVTNVTINSGDTPQIAQNAATVVED